MTLLRSNACHRAKSSDTRSYEELGEDPDEVASD
jgi:hypothetical protein